MKLPFRRHWQPWLDKALALGPGGLLRATFISDTGHVRNGWRILAFLLVFYMFRAIAEMAAGFLIRFRPGLEAPFFFADGVACVAASALLVKAEQRPWADTGFEINARWLRSLLGGTILGVLVMVAAAAAVFSLGGVRWHLNPAGTLRSIGAGAVLYLAVAFYEEAFYRGYLFSRMVEGLGAWPAQFLMALLFAWVHWGNPGIQPGLPKALVTLNIGLAAMLMGLCLLRTRSLALPIGVHLGWNFTQGTLLGFPVSGTTAPPGYLVAQIQEGRPHWVHGGAFGLEATLPCAALCLATILLLTLWKPRWKGMEEYLPLD